METSQILALKGTELGHSEWFLIDQQRVTDFADVTIDHQFIHVDEAAAAAGPFGGTIAHGFLTLSLLVHLTSELAPPLDNLVMGINYGFDRIRFMNPVRAGSRIRARSKLVEMKERQQSQILTKTRVTVEIEGEDKPALTADWLGMTVVQPPEGD